jgi:ABC-type dipeptide/oligopeptide/nickel transport system permease subunit
MVLLTRIGNVMYTVLIRSKRGLAGMLMLSIPIAMAVAPYLFTVYDPWTPSGGPFEPPSLNHLLGTNDVGIDLWSELVYGARISLLVGFSAAAASVALGTLVGIISGYFGGVLDEVLMAITDTMMLLPVLPFMLLLATMLGQGYQNIVLVIAIFSWPSIARLVRAQTLSIKQQTYIEAARAIGASNTRIMFRYILPQLLPLLVAFVILRVGGAMIAEASLSFLGLGDPTQKSWGAMIYWAQRSGAISSGAWWWITAPGLMITLSVMGFAQIGYALEEYVNPRLRR